MRDNYQALVSVYQDNEYQKEISTALNEQRGVLPRIINIVANKNCINKCRYCNIWKLRVQKDNLLKIVEKISNDDFFREAKLIKITGGEPFLSRFFIDCVKRIKERFPCAQITISTSCSPFPLVNNILEALKEVELTLSLSLNGDKEMHNYLKGNPGSFDDVMSVIKSVRKNHHLVLSFTIFPENIDSFSWILDFSKKNKLPLNYRIVGKSRYYYENHKAEYSFSDSDLKKLEESIFSNTQDIFKRGIVKHCLTKKRPVPCYALSDNLFIFPNGDIHPCLYRGKIGNIFEDNLKEMYDSEKFRELREKILGCNDCWTDCSTRADIYKNVLR